MAQQSSRPVWPYAGLIAALLALALAFANESSADATGQPDFLLPWQDGDSWVTGAAGFHGTNDALDFFPPDSPPSYEVRCTWDPNWVFLESARWVLASAPGTVTFAADPYVLINHGDGWFTRYYHLSGYQVSPGDHVETGQRLGHSSTLGECSSGPHVHFWVQGPNGQTTRDVELSGIPTTEIGRNQWISDTGNFEHGPGPTPTPTATPTATPTGSPTPEPTATPSPTLEPTPTPSPTPSPTPEPTPIVYAVGDANCDQSVTPLDAVAILRFSAGMDDSKCAASTGEINCDGVVSPADAMLVLEQTTGTGPGLGEGCISEPPPGDDVAPPTPTPAVTPEPSEAG